MGSGGAGPTAVLGSAQRGDVWPWVAEILSEWTGYNSFVESRPRGWQRVALQVVGLYLASISFVALSAWLGAWSKSYPADWLGALWLATCFALAGVLLFRSRSGLAIVLSVAASVAVGFAQWAGGDLLTQLVLRAEGRVAAVTVTEEDRTARGGTYYHLQHLDGSPVAGRLGSAFADEPPPRGREFVVVEDPQERVAPLQPSQVDSDGPRNFVAVSLGLLALIFPFWGVSNERSRLQGRPAV